MDTDIYFETLLKNLPAGVIVLNHINYVIYVNDQAAKIFDIPKLGHKIHIDKLFNNHTVVMDEFGHILPTKKFSQELTAKTIKSNGKIFQLIDKKSHVPVWYFHTRKSTSSYLVNLLYDISAVKKTQTYPALLDRVTNRLLNSMDYRERLQKFTELAIPAIADWCSIEMLDESGSLVEVSTSNIDTEKNSSSIDLRKKPADQDSDSMGIWKVIRSRRPYIYPDITNKQLASLAKNTRHKQKLLKLGLRSVVITPLIARNNVMGILILAHSISGRKFTQSNLNDIEALSQRAAVLIDNSRLFSLSTDLVKNQQIIMSDLLKSRHTLNLALKTNHMIIWEYDLHSRLISLTGELTQPTGVVKTNKTERLAKLLTQISPSDRQRIRQKLTKSYKSSHVLEDEFQLKDKTNPRWIHAVGEIVKNNQNKAERIVGIATDITAQKYSEEKNRTDETRFKLIFESSLDTILITDDQMRIVAINPAGLKLLSAPKSKLIRRSLLDIILPEQKDKFVSDWKKFLSSSDREGTINISDANGEKHILEYRANPHFIAKQSLFVLRDVTSRVIEEERKEHLLGITSHELRTPISSIKIFTDILKRQFLKENNQKIVNYLEKIDSKADTLTHLVGDLLDVTRIQQKKLEFNWEMFDPFEFMKQFVSDTQLSYITHKLRLSGKTTKPIVSDKNRLTQIVSNLVKNAVKYSPHATEVIIEVKNDNKNCIISIQDFGIGIPSKELSKIFNLYYRVTNPKGQKIFGLGMGLYISHQIISAMGGKLEVTSKINKGSTFIATIPLIPKIKAKPIIKKYE